MSTTVLSSKGQVIIPKPMRDSRQWRIGTRLAVIETSEGILIKPIEKTQKTELAKGLIAIRKKMAYRGPAVSIEQMNQAVQEQAARRAKT